jgi:hypothetical protein
VNAAEDDPPATVTEAGNVNLVLLLLTATAAAAGAFCESVISQVVVSGYLIAEGVQVRPETKTERVRLKLFVTPAADAVIVAFWASAESVPELAVKPAEAAPAGRVTEAGTESAGELLASAMVWADEDAVATVTVQGAVAELLMMGIPLTVGRVH